jgi:hypothetical protein
MKCLTIIVLVVCIAMKTTVIADSVGPQVPWVKTSKDGRYMFKMVPEKSQFVGEKLNVERDAFGVAYEITEGGELKELWRTKGWYAFEGYLSEDGRYFVRFGLWAEDQEKHTDLAVAFYDQGKLLKEYQVRELIKNPKLLQNTISHYFWRPEIQTKPNGFNEEGFHLVMIDKTTYSFDFKTGKIVATEKDEGAKSCIEIEKEKKAAAHEVEAFFQIKEAGLERLNVWAMGLSISNCYRIISISGFDGSTLGLTIIPFGIKSEQTRSILIYKDRSQTSDWEEGHLSTPKSQELEELFSAARPTMFNSDLQLPRVITAIDDASSVIIEEWNGQRYKMLYRTGTLSTHWEPEIKSAHKELWNLWIDYKKTNSPPLERKFLNLRPNQ